MEPWASVSLKHLGKSSSLIADANRRTAPGIEADVDDTAKGLICLHALGHTVSINNMIKHFECETHFQTYPNERDPSFSANCNALLALLCQADLSTFSAQILKVVHFLSKIWWDTDGPIKDKWVRRFSQYSWPAHVR